MKDLKYSLKTVEGLQLLEINDSLNAGTVESFVAVVKEIIQKESLVINVSDLGTISSSGLDALLEVSEYAKDQGKRVVLLWPDENLLSMTEKMDINPYLIFARSLEESKTKIKFYT